MFASIRMAVVTFFHSITHLFKALENVTKAMETASEVTILQAEQWKTEQLLELKELKKPQE